MSNVIELCSIEDTGGSQSHSSCHNQSTVESWIFL